jgi:hypothetical protein
MTVTCVEGLQELMEGRVRVVGTRRVLRNLIPCKVRRLGCGSKALVYKREIFGKPLIQSFLYYAVDFWGVLFFWIQNLDSTLK